MVRKDNFPVSAYWIKNPSTGEKLQDFKHVYCGKSYRKPYNPKLTNLVTILCSLNLAFKINVYTQNREKIK